jgi:hypothetical protein
MKINVMERRSWGIYLIYQLYVRRYISNQWDWRPIHSQPEKDCDGKKMGKYFQVIAQQ